MTNKTYRYTRRTRTAVSGEVLYLVQTIDPNGENSWIIASADRGCVKRLEVSWLNAFNQFDLYCNEYDESLRREAVEQFLSEWDGLEQFLDGCMEMELSLETDVTGRWYCDIVTSKNRMRLDCTTLCIAAA